MAQALDRRERIIALAGGEGWKTLAAIAQDVGVSRERVRQVLAQAGMSTVPKRAGAIDKRNTGIARMWEAEPESSSASIGRKFGVSVETVRTALKRAGIGRKRDKKDTKRVAARFLSKVAKSPDSDCWLWQGAILSNGYGWFRWAGSKYAHRVAYELHYGSLPNGLDIYHPICGVRHCVRPSHLEAAPQRTVVLRGKGPASINAKKTHCIRGHPFSAQNTRITHKRGRAGRTCLICARAAAKRYHQKRRDGEA